MCSHSIVCAQCLCFFVRPLFLPSWAQTIGLVSRTLHFDLLENRKTFGRMVFVLCALSIVHISHAAPIAHECDSSAIYGLSFCFELFVRIWLIRLAIWCKFQGQIA